MQTTSGILEPVESPALLDVIELILKDPPALERIIRHPLLAAELIPRFLAVALIGFTLFGVAMALVIHSVGMQVELAPIKGVIEGTAPTLIRFEQSGTSHAGIMGAFSRGVRLIAAYDLGLIAAAGVCLPSLYFYGLLAGVPMSMARVTVHTLKAMS